MKYQSNKQQVLKALADAQERTLEAIGAFVRGEAILRAPVDTGNLRGSISHEVHMEKKAVTIGTNVEYAPFIEKGTGIYNIDGQGRQSGWVYTDSHGKTVFTRGSRAQPFLTPAIEDNIERVRKLAKEWMRLD